MDKAYALILGVLGKLNKQQTTATVGEDSEATSHSEKHSIPSECWENLTRWFPTTEELTIGPIGHQWRYSPSTKNFDLSPVARPLRKFTVATTRNEAVTSITIDPSVSALVVVDMQNFFLDPTCMEHVTGLKAVDPIIKVIQKCRAVGIKIIWLNWALNDEDMSTMSTGVLRGFMKDKIMPNTRGPWLGLGADLGGSRGRCLFANTWNADIHPLLKPHTQDSDIHCTKNRMSGLWNPEQPLWKALRREALKTLVFTGVNTDQCVLGTLVDGYNAGWDCVIIEDACGTNTVNGHDVSITNVAFCYGFVTDSASIVAGKLQ